MTHSPLPARLLPGFKNQPRITSCRRKPPDRYAPIVACTPLAGAVLLLILWHADAFGTSAAGFLPFTNALDILFLEIVGPVARGLMFIMIAAGLLLWAGSSQDRGLALVGKALIVLALIGSIPAILGALGINTATL